MLMISLDIPAQTILLGRAILFLLKDKKGKTLKIIAILKKILARYFNVKQNTKIGTRGWSKEFT